MFHRKHPKLNYFRQKLSTRFAHQEEKKNKDIHIRDIFIYPQRRDESFGEAKSNTNRYKDCPALTRLIDHIEFLASVTNKYHMENYCIKEADGAHRIKPDCLNKITRSLLNEFSLYTSQPLTVEQFQQLLYAIVKIANNKLSNVHLLLSSIPVMMEDKRILNMSLYVQCGVEPTIKTVCKGRKSPCDVKYEKSSNYSQQSRETFPANISPLISSLKGTVITNNSLFIVKTEGGAEYTQAIDICLDHYFRHSKELLKKSMDIDIEKDRTFLPNQVDHVVTSNSISIFEHSKMSESIVHIDTNRNKAMPVKDEKVNVSHLSELKNAKYTEMSIQNSEQGIVVENPAFGSNFRIVPTEERKLGVFVTNIKEKIEERNNKVKAKNIESSIAEISVTSPVKTLKKIDTTSHYEFIKKWFYFKNNQLEFVVKRNDMDESKGLSLGPHK